MTLITIITGRLGSGKTTILNNILRTKPVHKNVDIIINEISPLNVDKSFLTSPFQVTEISDGCTCCTKSEDLKRAINNSMNNRNPDMIIIETTGVANPSNFVTSLDLEDTYFTNIVFVIDLYKFTETNGFSKTTLRNASNATTIILSKADLVSGNILENALLKLKKASPDAKIVASNNGNISYEDIQVQGKPVRRVPATKNPLKEFIFYLFPELKNQHKSTAQVFSFETKSAMNSRVLESFISRLPRNIDRAKGIIKTTNGSVKFNYAVGLLRMENSLEQPKTSKIVLIGRMTLHDKIRYMRAFWNMRKEHEMHLPEIYSNLKLLFA